MFFSRFPAMKMNVYLIKPLKYRNYRLTMAIYFLIVIGAAACKSQNVTNVKHEFGKTRNESSRDLSPCTSDTPDDSGYLKMVANYIMANNPATFSGRYDPSRFCFSLPLEEQPNAMADPHTGQISVNSSLLLNLKTDAEVAAVIAHELAHVTMQSGTVSFEIKFSEVIKSPQFEPLKQSLITADSDFDKLFRASFDAMTVRRDLMSRIAAKLEGEAATEFQKYLKKGDKDAFIPIIDKAAVEQGLAGEWNQAKSVYESKQAEWLKTGDQLQRIRAQIDAILIPIVGVETRNNWQEQEADGVGLELYMRAGFDPALFSSMFFNLMGIDKNPEKIRQCREMFDAIRFSKDVTVPGRGTESHPEYCWRIYNVAQEELRGSSRESYASLLRQLAEAGTEPIAILEPGALARLQEALRQRPSPAEPAISAAPKD